MKWEYKTERFLGENLNKKIEEKMNSLGKDGWELVTAMPHYELRQWFAFFKRKKKED